MAQKKVKEIVDPAASKSSLAEKSNQPIASREKVERKDVPAKEIERTSTFSLENEIAELKVSIPFTQLMKNNSYKNQVSKL